MDKYGHCSVLGSFVCTTTHYTAGSTLYSKLCVVLLNCTTKQNTLILNTNADIKNPFRALFIACQSGDLVKLVPPDNLGPDLNIKNRTWRLNILSPWVSLNCHFFFSSSMPGR